MLDAQGDDDGEDAGAEEADQTHEGKDQGLSLCEEEARQGDGHDEDGNLEELAVCHLAEQEGADEGTGGLADEIDGDAELGVVGIQPAALDQEFGGDDIAADIQSDDGEDAEEAVEDVFVAQELQRLAQGAAPFRRGFFDLGAKQPEGRDQRDDGEGREHVFPGTEPGRAAEGQVRRRAGGQGLQDLAGGDVAGQGTLAADDIGEQGIEGHLDDGVADTQHRAGDQAGRQVVAEQGDQHADEGDGVAHLDGGLASDLVHHQGRRRTQDQEPEEDGHRNQAGERFTQLEVFLDVAGHDAGHVGESHHHEGEKDGQDCSFLVHNYEVI